MQEPLLRSGGHEAPADALVRAAEEDDFIRHLMLMEGTSAREAAAILVRQAIGDGPDPQPASYLLFDLLCRADRVVAESTGAPRRPVADRLALAARLAGASSREDLLSIFWSAYEDLTAPLDAPRPAVHPAVELVKEFIRENYASKLALSEAARSVRISRNYLSHLFRRHCGQTVTEFLHRTRMKEAERLLASGEGSVSQIAYRVGYQNYRDFHRNFVRYTRTSPKRFRQITALARSPLHSPPP